jgi:hypothetical protein
MFRPNHWAEFARSISNLSLSAICHVDIWQKGGPLGARPTVHPIECRWTKRFPKWDYNPCVLHLRQSNVIIHSASWKGMLFCHRSVIIHCIGINSVTAAAELYIGICLINTKWMPCTWGNEGNIDCSQILVSIPSIAFMVHVHAPSDPSNHDKLSNWHLWFFLHLLKLLKNASKCCKNHVSIFWYGADVSNFECVKNNWKWNKTNLFSVSNFLNNYSSEFILVFLWWVGTGLKNIGTIQTKIKQALRRQWFAGARGGGWTKGSSLWQLVKKKVIHSVHANYWIAM